jgi:hypothetical protein
MGAFGLQHVVRKAASRFQVNCFSADAVSINQVCGNTPHGHHWYEACIGLPLCSLVIWDQPRERYMGCLYVLRAEVTNI